MSVKLAVFDMAGTTVYDDNTVGKTFQKAFKNNGYDISLEDINPVLGYHKPLAIRRLLENAGEEITEEIIHDIHEDFQNELLDYYEYDPGVKSLPGVEEVFQQLKERGIRVALNTGFSREIADTIVHRLQWEEKGLVDDIIASDEVQEGRPASYMIKLLMSRAGVDDPLEVAKIGDTIVDIQEGKAAGCSYVIAVTTGAQKREKLEALQPTHIIDSLREVMTILK